MSESDVQKEVCKYLDSKNLLYFAIPNNPKFKPAGMKKGVPDLFVAQLKGNYGGLFIEVKQGKEVKGVKVSPEQEQWRADLLRCNYMSVIAYGAEQAFKFIDEYLKG